MTVAAVQFYDVILFVHIMAAIIAFGPSFAYPVFAMVAERYDPRSIPVLMRAFQTVDRYLVTSAAIVVIAAGIYLTIDRWEFGDVFVSLGIIIVLVVLGLTHGFFIPRERRIAELAERDIAASGAGEVQVSKELRSVVREVSMVGNLTALAIIVAVFLMTVKPFV